MNVTRVDTMPPIVLATPTSPSKLSHLVFKLLLLPIWVISPSQRWFFARIIVVILPWQGRKRVRNMFRQSSQKSKPARSAGFSPAMTKAVTMWPPTLSPPKPSSKGSIGTSLSTTLYPLDVATAAQRRQQQLLCHRQAKLCW